ncbi:MAG: hypothetical protein ACO1OB_04010 [Archangium sp.]
MSLVVALLLAAWPLPRDAGVADYAQPSNWPNEPGWNDAWPLKSYADGGAAIDRAWSFTRGSPDVTIAVAAHAVNVSDPVIAKAWRLNAGEFPLATDVNDNGRIDVGDLTAPDVNQNGAIDLEDVIAAFSDDVDQDENGRIDDLCGWDFVRDAGVVSAGNGGAPWRSLVAPLNDGLEGIGVCPDCTLVPLVVNDATLDDAIRFPGVKVLVLPQVQADVSSALHTALSTTSAVVIGRPSSVSFPLALHPKVHTTQSTGCVDRSLTGSVSFGSRDCVDDATMSFAGSAALLLTLAPDAGADQIVGLLGRSNVGAAMESAEQTLPPTPEPLPRLLPLTVSPHRPAERCSVDGVEFDCDGGVPLAASPMNTLDADPTGAFVRFEETLSPYVWSTSIAAPAVTSVVGQLPPLDFGPGSGPPRFVDVDGTRSDTLIAASLEGLRGFANEWSTFAPELASGRWPPAFADLDSDGAIDMLTLGDDGALEVYDWRRHHLTTFSRQLSGTPAGPVVVAQTLTGFAIVTVTVDGGLTHTVGTSTWTHQLPAPQRSSPAAGRIDDDLIADFASANGVALHVLLADEFGVSLRSWSTPSRATQALLADLVDDERLEIIVDAVYAANGTKLLEFDQWKPSVVPPAIARLGAASDRSLIQVEAGDAGFELTRYDVELALRSGHTLVVRDVILRIDHVPARGGFVVADYDADRRPDVILPTEDGLLFIVNELGESPPESPLPALGSVLSAPALGVARDRIELAVRTTRGDVIRWLVRGRVSDIEWESSGHDRQNSNNAETPLPERVVGGLGITEPPIFGPGTCSCSSSPALTALALLFLLRRASRARR